MKKRVLLFLAILFTFSLFLDNGISAQTNEYHGTEKGDKIFKYATKMLEKRYEALLSGNIYSLDDHEGNKINKDSKKRIEAINDRDLKYINDLGAEYKKINITNIENLTITKENSNFIVEFRAEVEKYYKYKNKINEETPWLEVRNHKMVLQESKNNSFVLIDYVFEDETDYYEIKDTKSNKPTIQEMIEEQMNSGIPLEYNENSNSFSILSTRHTYNRSGAQAYAKKNYNNPNPYFRTFLNNCTNFVSQVINRGGGVNMDWWGDLRWWYQGTQNTTSWSVAHDYVYYSRRNDDAGGLGAYYISHVKDLRIGSLVGYDFNDNGIFQHLSIVVGYDSNGEPLTAQNTPSDYNRPWKSVSSGTKHYFLQTNNYWYAN